MKKASSFVILLIATSPIALLLAGYLGFIHPVFDAISVTRLYVLVALVFIMLVFIGASRWRLVRYYGLAILFGLATTLPHFRVSNVPDETSSRTLLQSNLLWFNNAQQLSPHARSLSADIVTLQEVTHRSKPNIEAMRRDFPSQIICGSERTGIVAVLSRYPLEDTGCSETAGMAWMRVSGPNGPVTIVSLHLHWPWPYRQAEQLEIILPELRALPQPIILAGDFNTVPWSNAVSQIERATGTETISGVRLSFSFFNDLIHLPLDHVLVPTGTPASAEAGPKLGSDHQTVRAEIGHY